MAPLVRTVVAGDTIDALFLVRAEEALHRSRRDTKRALGLLDALLVGGPVKWLAQSPDKVECPLRCGRDLRHDPVSATIVRAGVRDTIVVRAVIRDAAVLALLVTLCRHAAVPLTPTGPSHAHLLSKIRAGALSCKMRH